VRANAGKDDDDDEFIFEFDEADDEVALPVSLLPSGSLKKRPANVSRRGARLSINTRLLARTIASSRGALQSRNACASLPQLKHRPIAADMPRVDLSNGSGTALTGV
jgi:hypothetical protein